MKMKNKIPLFILIFISSSCVTRLKMPIVDGNVYDLNNKPLQEVNVCLNDNCTTTNEEGYFYFDRKKSKEISIVGGEAPPIIFELKVSKTSYNDTIIYYKNLYGGANIELKINYKALILKHKK